MAERTRPHAVLAEFSEPAALLAGARALREQGWRIETYTPFPVDGLSEAIGFEGRAIPRAALAGGLVGVLAGFAMQAGANLSYPLDIGGRAVVAVPAFVLVTLECGIFGAVFASIGAMFAGNRLPRLHHPLFDAERFGLASDDRFFLAILAGPRAEDKFDAYEARAALWRLQPVDVVDVGERDVR